MDDLGTIQWEKAKRCSDSACVELGQLDDKTVLLRDSKNPDGEPIVLDKVAYNRLIADIQGGKFRF